MRSPRVAAVALRSRSEGSEPIPTWRARSVWRKHPSDMSAVPSEPADNNAPPERFDEILARLRGLVEKLESGHLPLEDGLRFFEEGMALCRRGAEILDRAEKRVEILLAGPGGVRTAPFDAGGQRDGNE
jgi:exodeoxyribonuclease VII small subunit